MPATSRSPLFGITQGRTNLEQVNFQKGNDSNKVKETFGYKGQTRSGSKDPEAGGGFQSTTAVDPVLGLGRRRAMMESGRSAGVLIDFNSWQVGAVLSASLET